MNLDGLILCGGASRRMGSPKALLEFQGETFLDRLIRIFSQSCRTVTVVLGHEPETILAGVRRPSGAQFVVNAAWEAGQLSSLQQGLRTVPEDADAVLLTPVDYPAVEAATVAALARAAESGEDGNLIFVPTYDGRHGHPICFRSRIRAEILALPIGATARDAIHRYRSRTRYIEVADPAILQDVDSPEAYRILRTGRTA